MYETDVTGRFRIEPPLNQVEADYLRRFCETRRVRRRKGPYAAHDPWSGYTTPAGDQEAAEATADVIDVNQPAEGQPSLYCPWTVAEDCRHLVWNEQGAHSRLLLAWLEYLIDHFLDGSACRRREARRAGEEQTFNAFSFDHRLFGIAQARGEDADDHWALSVDGIEVTCHEAMVFFDPPLPALNT